MSEMMKARRFGATAALALRYRDGDGERTVWPALIGGELLVDCGYPGQLDELGRAAAAAGAPLSGLRAVALTHHDYDHVGASAALRRAYPSVRVYASEDDAARVEGRAKSRRLEQAEALEPTLPPEMKAWSRGFMARLAAVEPARVDEFLVDGLRLGPAGARAFATPGHMPAHFSVFVEDDGLLIAGDALVVEQGRLALANPRFTLDMPRALESTRRIVALRPKAALCYHGGLWVGDVADALGSLLLAAGGAVS